jgi:divalent metal cation (Fe/Co/Zn/Cd) transporter
MPVAYVTSYVVPGIGLASGILVGIGALIIAVVIEVRIYRDLKGLSDAFADFAVAKRKRISAAAKKRLRDALADIGRVVSLLIVLALIAPVLIIIPGIGVVAVILPIVGIVVVAIYGWKSWEIVREELQKIFDVFAKSLAKAFEK